MLDLTCPNFQILIGSSDISPHVTGFSFRHPLAEPSTPLIWTGQIELDLTVDTSLGATFFDDEVNPSIWLSGLQSIDVYFNGTWWQRFRIKPSGYRYDQITGQAIAEITDIIGILDSYQPSADAPEFKTGANNFWNDLAVKLINKQASLMGRSVTVETPPYGIGGYYQIPRTVSGSYIKEAQKMAGERGFWMWSDKETVKWAEYPQAASSIVWQKSRKELLSYTRQQGLDPVKSKVTVSATHEEVDVCGEVYPRTTYVFASSAVVIDSSGNVGQRYQTIASITIEDKIITNNYIYTLTKKVVGNPMLTLFGGVLEVNGTLTGNPPEVKGYKVTKENAFGGFAFIYKYTKGNASFTWDWTRQQPLLDERDVTTYENVPLDAQNASKILKRVITRSEPYAKFPEGLQYTDVSSWFVTNVNNPAYVTERTTTTYKYNEIFRDDIIVTAGQRLFEIAEIVELKEQIYFQKNPANVFPTLEIRPVPQSKTVTKYIKECQGRWKEIKEVWQNKGKSTTSTGYLYSVNRSEKPVTAIPDITYRPSPFPVKQKPLLGAVETGYAGVSPYVNSNEFAQASTLTTKAECERYARYLGQLKWQRYYGRELAAGFGTVLGYVPFQGVYAGNGAYIRDRFGVSLNYESDTWQFVEDCIGNKVATIPEISSPSYPAPALLISTLNIGAMPNQSYTQGLPITSLIFNSSGGTTPYTYSSTTLPSGLSLSSGGVLSGTPTAITTTSVTVTVTDSLSATANTTFNIAVIAAPIPLLITSETITIDQIYSVIGEMSFLDGILIPATVDGNYKVTGEMFFLGLQPDAVVSGNYKVIGDMSFLTLSSIYKVIGEMSFAPPTSLLAKTIAYWKFDEASGTRADETANAYDLTRGSSGSILSQTGLIGSALVPTDYLEFDATGTDFDLRTNNHTSFVFWVKPTPDSPTSFSGDLISNGHYQVSVTGLGYPFLRILASGGVQDVTGTTLLTRQSWNRILVEIDITAGTSSITLNDGTADTISYVPDVTIDPDITKVGEGVSGLLFDGFFATNTALTVGEDSDSWNDGLGLDYPFTTAPTNFTFASAVGTYTVLDGDNVTVSTGTALTSATIASFNSVTIHGLTRSDYGDLSIYISNGVRTRYLVAVGGSFTNPTYSLNGNYTFVNSGTDWYSAGTDPVPTGSNYQSSDSLSAFVGDDLNDTWTLFIQDEVGGHGDGTFTHFSFNIDI